MLELGLTRLLSVTTWYHFAFFAISLALLGLGASGVFVYAAQQRLKVVPTPNLLVFSAFAFAGLSVLLMVLYLYTPLGVAGMKNNFLLLMFAILVGTAPFFAGGLYLTIAISRYSESITRVYAADLLGAAGGCLLFIPALGVFGGPGPMLGAAVLSLLGALGYIATPKMRRMTLALLSVAVGILTVQAVQPILDIQYGKDGPIRPSLFSEWNSYSRVAVYDEPQVDWGLSQAVDVVPAPSLRMDIDVSAGTAILLPDSREDVEYLRYDVSALGHWLLPEDSKTLIIGPGGGRDIWTSLVFGARSVTGIEINSIIVDGVMQGAFFNRSAGIYAEPGVSVVVDDGRNYIARSDERYDLIQASLVDTWAATSAGAFALTESNLYTVEAFVEYLSHLSDDGILSFSRWRTGSQRLITLARAAGEELGWGGIADRLFVAASHDLAGLSGVVTVVVSRQPLTGRQIGILTETSERLGFELLYAPAAGNDQSIGQPEFIELATAPDLAPVLAASPTDISPVNDDKPFFFQSSRLDDLGSFFRGFLGDTARVRDDAPTAGIDLIVRLLVLSVFSVILFIFVPLRFIPSEHAPRTDSALLHLSYFAFLGVGFIVMEVRLIQRFVLFLGHPVYALTVVLFSFLLGAGLGSAFSRRFGSPERVARWALVGVFALGIVYALELPDVLAAGLGLDRSLRIAVTLALLLPLSTLMGMPLPAGIRMLADRSSAMVAWAWGINGATSVLGSALAILLAVSLGFTAVTVIASVFYAAALLSHTVSSKTTFAAHPSQGSHPDASLV